MKIRSILLGIFFLFIIAIDINAASFDCGQAASEVEKIICSDDELSRLDEVLTKAYLRLLKRTATKDQVVKGQKQWLREKRNACQNAECLKNAYETRIRELGLSSSYGEKREAASKGSGISSFSESRVTFCKEVSRMIKDETINKHEPERIDMPIEVDPHGSEYRNLDIDGDGIPDKITVSSGSMESLLVVQLSGGGEYHLDEDRIMVLKLNKQIYALVTCWKWDRRPDGSRTGRITGHRLYKLTKSGAKLDCDKEDFERR